MSNRKLSSMVCVVYYLLSAQSVVRVIICAFMLRSGLMWFVFILHLCKRITQVFLSLLGFILMFLYVNA